METRRAILLAAILLALTLSTITSEADGENRVTVTGGVADTLERGSDGTLTISIRSLDGISSLDLMVYYPNDDIGISDVANLANCEVWDHSVSASYIRVLYLFDGNGTDSMELLKVTFHVDADASLGTHSFSIIVNEANGSDLQPLDVRGSEAIFTVEGVSETPKECCILSDSRLSTSVGETFSLTYRLDSNMATSGSIRVGYDPSVFKLESVETGSFLESKQVAISDGNPGTLRVTFTSTSCSDGTDIMTLSFRTIVNADITSSITISVPKMCDAELNDVMCRPFSTDVAVSYDPSDVGNVPNIRCVGESDGTHLDIGIRMDAGTGLGAGDFILTFDPDALTYTGYDVPDGFEATYLVVNGTQSAEGIIKVSVLSLDGISKACTMATLGFTVHPSCQRDSTYVGLEGRNLSDNMTEPIALNIIGTTVTLPKAEHTFGEEPQGDGSGHWYVCTLCGAQSDRTAHEPSGTWSSDASYHWHACSICGWQCDRSAHSGSGPKCPVCDASMGSQSGGGSGSGSGGGSGTGPGGGGTVTLPDDLGELPMTDGVGILSAEILMEIIKQGRDVGFSGTLGGIIIPASVIGKVASEGGDLVVRMDSDDDAMTAEQRLAIGGNRFLGLKLTVGDRDVHEFGSKVYVTMFLDETVPGMVVRYVSPDGTLEDMDTSIANKGSVRFGTDHLSVFMVSVPHSVSVTVEGDGTATASVTTAVSGTEIGLEHTAGDGYEFKGWGSDDVTITDGVFVMPDRDVTITAVFGKVPEEMTDDGGDDGNDLLVPAAVVIVVAIVLASIAVFVHRRN